MDPLPAAPRALPAVQTVSRWALINAALAFMLHSGGGIQLLTAAKQSFPGRWMPRCAAAQAAAAGLALLLPAAGRRSRMFLASAALAATFANHLMYAWLVDLAVAADPAGHLHLRNFSTTAAVDFFGVADFLAFLTLVEGDLGAACRVFLSGSVHVLLIGEIFRYCIH